MDSCSVIGSDSDIDYDEFNVTDCNCSNPKHWYVETCDCDYPESSAPPPLSEVLAPGIIYAFVFVLGTVGNSLVIYVVIRYKKMRSVTNFFLSSLSTADLFLLFFCVPIKYTKYLLYSWTMGGFFCWSHHYVQLFIMICSVLTLTAISVERYTAITHPIRTVWLSTIERAQKIVAIIWIVSAILAIPAAFTQTLIQASGRNNLTAYWCLKGFPSEGWEKAFALYQFLVLFLVPVATMIFCYTAVGRTLKLNQRGHFGDQDELRKGSNRSLSIRLGSVSVSTGWTGFSARKLSQTDATSEDVLNGNQKMLLRKSSRIPDQSVKQIVQMLVFVVIIFVICWTPYLLDHLLVAFGYVCEYSFQQHLRILRMAFGIMAFANSSINPIVYAFMSKNFRTTFMAVCCRWPSNDPYGRQRAFLSQLPHGTAQETTPRASRKRESIAVYKKETTADLGRNETPSPSVDKRNASVYSSHK